MPIYAYKCQNCDHAFDKFQHFTDDPLTLCPVCHEEALRKVYSPVGIVFKGKGFYATDHRSPSGQSPGKANGDTSTNSSTDNNSSTAPETVKSSNVTKSDK